MLLCIDIGNTNVTIGVYDGEALIAHWRLSTDHQKMPDEYGLLLSSLLAHRGLTPADITGVALASVVPPLTDVFREVCAGYLAVDPLVVDTGVRTGVSVRFDPPRDVGADRIVNVAAAYRCTAAGCIVVSARHHVRCPRPPEYLGRAIAQDRVAPRRSFSARRTAAHHFAPASGRRGSLDAMRSGIVFGYVGLVGDDRPLSPGTSEGMRVIATGGQPTSSPRRPASSRWSTTGSPSRACASSIS